MRDDVHKVIEDSQNTAIVYLAVAYERWLMKYGLTPTRENFETFLVQHL